MPRARAIPITPHIMKCMGDRIRTARALAGLTRPELEKLHGIKGTTVAKWENGLVMPSLKSIHQLVHALKTQGVVSTVEWFLHGKGAEAYTFNDPIGPLKEDASPFKLDKEILLMEEIRIFKQIYNHAVFCFVNDDTMAPQFSIGDYVGGLKLPPEQKDQALNKTCIVELKDGRKKLRQVIAGSGNDLYSLCGTNARAQLLPSIMMDVELNWIAPIIWHRFVT